MPRRVHITRMHLSYGDGLVLHTATSGAVPVLDELRLVVEQDGAPVALGAARLNIEYLTGIPAERLVADALDAARATDWSQPWTGLAAELDRLRPDLPAAVRMMFEMAALDARAREAGKPLAEYLGAPAAPETICTNQTLFRADMDVLLRRAEAYVGRGFFDLKLRVGFGPFAEDLERLRALRERFGPELRLSADTNGQWSEEDAAENLRACGGLGLAYVEQPVAAGAWDAVVRLSRASPVPIMLDESLADLDSIDRLASSRAAPLAHLKLAKLGGIDRLMAAAERLRAAGIGFMVGQMNEGVPSTLAAAHAAAALGSTMNELYGADGLADDPAGGLDYRNGHLVPPRGPGLGVPGYMGDGGTVLWENTA